ncbi:UDP-glucuronosyltransferase 3A1 [Verticillium dahliae VDG2]|nr:UDP-glucuronosyltransferase 3A1 [Verticillium dahliae VDG2]
MEDGFREEEDPLGTDTLRTASDRGRAHAHHAHHHPTHAVDGHHSYDKHDDDDDDDARHQDSLHRQHQHQQHTQAHTEYTYPVYDEPPELSPIDTPYTPGSRPVATQTTFDIDSLDPFAASVAFDSPTGDGIDGGIGSHVVAVVTPDDFYRDYRSASSTHYHHQHSRQPSSSSERAPMATSVPRPRDPASLRSNGNGTTAKHPPMPTALNGLRTATRSVSAPIDPSSTTGPKRLNNAARQPSVKDLTKKFDQGPPTAIPQLPVRTGIPSRPNKPATSSDKPLPTAPVGQRQSPYSTLRTSVDRNLTPDSAKATRSTQRTKFVAEDQTSNNSQSFASRIGKPRTPVALNAQPSQSTSTVSQKHSFQPTTASPNASPMIPQSQTLLFGEILPDQRDNHTLGHGIEGSGSRPRRTSESNVSSIRSAHQRTLSDPDLIEPSSPTDWYRIANDDTNGLQPQQTRHSKSHVRAQSDTPSIIPRKPPPPAVGATERSRAVSPSSRLPITVRKLASPTPSLSTSSPSGGNSRANSPPNLHRITPHGRPSRAASAQGYRSKTPTQSTRRAPPQGLTTPSNNGRLTPYGGEPVPKLSPPLRSSRPRQSVATATTTSSRMKALERARSPHYHATRNAQKSTEAPTRRRKISVGPVDFEQRREHIRLAYTKSIRDSQAREARLQAAERRKKELEVAARTKAALTASQAAANQDERTAHDHAAASDLDSRLFSPLKVPTGTECGEPSPTTLSPQPDVVKDSPTLGIPGSFPAGSPAIEFEEAPPSAISMATDVTEFDDEPQVFPPVQPDHGAASSGLGLALPDMPGSFTVSEADVPEDDERLGARTPPFEAPSTDEHVTYHDPFPREAVDDGHVSIKIAATDVPQQMPEEAPQMAEPQPDTASNSEAYKDEYEPLPYSSPSLETTVKILHRESDQFTKPERSSIADEPHDDSYYMSLDQHEARAFRTFVRQEQSQGESDKAQSPSRQGEHRHDTPLSYRIKEGLVSSRVSTCDSDAPDDTYQTTQDSLPTLDTSHSLTIPPPLPVASRYSHQSAWTDFSVESNDTADCSPRDSARHSDALPLPNPPFASDARYRSSPSGASSARHSELYGSEPSLLEMADGHSSPRSKEPQLPELDTGGGFSIPYLSDRLSRDFSSVPLPEYSPPPVPFSHTGSVKDSRRPPSSNYQPETRPGSTLVGSSRRPSEDLTRPTSNAHSIDHISLSTRDPSLGGQTLNDQTDPKVSLTGETDKEHSVPITKEQRRLQQRRNVIKELVDTEMVFVRDMNIVEEIYKGTAEACPKLDGKTSKIIFRNVDEIVAFHTAFLVQLKDAVAAVYIPQGRRSSAPKEASIKSNSTGSNSGAQSQTESDDAKDRTTTLGPLFQLNAEKMKIAHEGFLRNSDLAAKRLIQIQQDPTVQVWLNECHEVAKDLTAAWDLDSLLIKPMQRLTKYPNLILTILQHTPPDHPDRPALVAAKDTLEIAIIEINKTKKNFELVGQIVGRKRKESDVKAGFARAFGKRVDRLQATSTRIPEDPEYAKLHEKFGDDYLRLQVVLRDVEFYTRQVTSYVHEFLQYLSSMELVMRLQPGSYPEIESKWVQFNVSMRDIEKVALDQHLAQVRKQVIEPFELVIKAYGNPSLAMKKREKRRLDFERAEQIKKGGKTLDPKLKELVEQYDALNDTLIKELPQLSALTEKVGKICLENLVNIQAKWYSIWKDKVKVVLADTTSLPEMPDVVSTFQHDFKFAQEQLDTIGILHPEYKGRASQSTITTRASTEDGTPRNRPRPAELTPRNRGRSMNSEQVPALPTPEFKRSSGQFTLSPTSTVPSPHQYYYRDYYTNANATASGSGSGSGQRPSVPPSPRTEDSSPSLRAAGGYPLARPSTGRSYDSGGLPRESSDSSMHNRRDSNSTYNSGYPATEPKRYSGLFHSALPLPDSAEESQRSSRASSRERFPESSSYNVLWLAASLFEFNIETTKNEAGYPYLTYQAGEIFDVIAEKGELWLAKNQDDPREQVGWIWSKHFARLADS